MNNNEGKKTTAGDKSLNKHVAGMGGKKEMDTYANAVRSGYAAQQHSGNKYHKKIVNIRGDRSCTIDVYSVIEAFGVTCPARQQAVKKLLCAGQRGKNDVVSDLKEAVDAIVRALDLVRARELGGYPSVIIGCDQGQKEQESKNEETALDVTGESEEEDGDGAWYED